MKHKCHAIGCTVKTHYSLLMCLKHWELVPSVIKDKIRKEFNPEQLYGRVRPSGAWLKAARMAIMAVKELEKNDE